MLAACRLGPPPTGQALCEARTDVAAEVNGRVLTLVALDERLHADTELSADIDGLAEEFRYSARRSTLERMIADQLLLEEARRLGVSPAALHESVLADVSVSDQEVETSLQLARSYKGDNPMLDRRVQRLLAGDETEARERIRAFDLEEKKKAQLLQRALPLRREAAVTVCLKKPARSAVTAAQRGKAS
jgi:hypothetical protein